MKRFKRLLKALFGERSKREVHCVAYFEADVLRLKIRVIIKISKKSLLSYKCGLILIGMKPKKTGRLPQFLVFFHEYFMDWSLGS